MNKYFDNYPEQKRDEILQKRMRASLISLMIKAKTSNT